MQAIRPRLRAAVATWSRDGDGLSARFRLLVDLIPLIEAGYEPGRAMIEAVLRLRADQRVVVPAEAGRA